MKHEALVYWLIHDSELFERNPGLMRNTKVVCPEFDGKGISFGRGCIGSVWPNPVKIFITGNQPVDYLLCRKRIDIISDKAKKVIERVASKDVEFLPVMVITDDGNPFSQMHYWALNILTILDALDWVNTKWTTPAPPNHDDPMAVMKIILPGLHKEKIDGAHFFQLAIGGKIRNTKFLSYTLVKELIKEGSTLGMEFGPIKTTNNMNRNKNEIID